MDRLMPSYDEIMALKLDDRLDLCLWCAGQIRHLCDDATRWCLDGLVQHGHTMNKELKEHLCLLAYYRACTHGYAGNAVMDAACRVVSQALSASAEPLSALSDAINALAGEPPGGPSCRIILKRRFEHMAATMVHGWRAVHEFECNHPWDPAAELDNV